MRPQNPPFTFAVIAPQEGLSPWQKQCLDLLCADDAARLAHTFLAPPKMPPSTLLKLAFGTGSTPPENPFLEPSSPLPGEASNLAQDFPDPDFILDFTGTHAPRFLREKARFGVWSFAFGGETGPEAIPCFTETLRGSPLLHGVLYKQCDSPVKGIVLYAFSVKSRPSLPRNIAAMTHAAIHAPKGACARVRAGQFPDEHAPTNFCQAKRPSLLPTLKALLGNCTGLVKMAGERLFEEDWNVGIHPLPISSFLTSPPTEPQWLFQPSSRYFHADPFGIKTEKGVTLFYEKYDKGECVGRLAKATFDGDLAREGRPPLEAGFHLSYPYVFTYGETMYALPESNESGQLCVYEVDSATGDFHSPTVILEGNVADATIFPHEERWWMFAVRPGFQLNAWFADHPLGPWEEHSLNPLKIDPASSRPGGTPFVHHGTLYRPAQDCTRTYGGGIALCKVEELTPCSFRESVVSTLAPALGSRYPDGFHTLSAVGDMTVVDGKRIRFTPIRGLSRLIKTF